MGGARSHVLGPRSTTCFSNRLDVLEGESRIHTFGYSFQVWMRLSPKDNQKHHDRRANGTSIAGGEYDSVPQEA